ncbi:MAG: insulinase family protein [Desulfuromonas sp.]|nr:insulinase family protein [Desulfuromonas sp.]
MMQLRRRVMMLMAVWTMVLVTATLVSAAEQQAAEQHIGHYIKQHGQQGDEKQRAEQRPDDLVFLPLEFSIEYPEKFRLNNGIQVYFKEDYEVPLLDVTVVVDAGKVGVPNKKAGLAELLAVLLRSGGAGPWSAEQFDQQLEALAADMQVSAGSYTTTVTLSLLREDAEQGLALLEAMLRQPRFDEQRFEIKRQQLLESIRRRGDNAGALARQLLMARLYAGHPLATFASQQSVAAVCLDDIKQHYRRYFSAQNTRIVISGALSCPEAQAWLEQTFGDWHTDGERQQIPAFADSDPAGILVVDRPLPQTTVLLGEIGIEKSNPDLHAVQVMNYILGGGGFGSRLMREVRSNRGLAYSVYSYFSVGRRLLGPFIAGCGTKNASVAEVVTLMRQQMTQMREQPVTMQELEQAKLSLVNSFVFAFDNSHALANRIMKQEMYGYPENYLEEYRQRIAAVSVADVQRVARCYLHPDKQLLILIGDRQQLQPSLDILGETVEEVALDSLL